MKNRRILILAALLYSCSYDISNIKKQALVGPINIDCFEELYAINESIAYYRDLHTSAQPYLELEEDRVFLSGLVRDNLNELEEKKYGLIKRCQISNADQYYDHLLKQLKEFREAKP